jgi:chromosome partitioning protein
LFPSSIALANFTTPFGVEDFSLLKDVLDTVKNDYDYILIDCSPSLGLSLENALIASDYVLIPIQTRAFSVQGISDLYGTIEKIKKKANPKLSLLGAVFNQYEESRALSGLAEGVKKYFPVFKTVIPRMEGIPQAQVIGKMLKECDDKIRGPFLDLAAEVRSRANDKENCLTHALRKFECEYAYACACMHVCMSTCMHICMFSCMYVCMPVYRLYVCIYKL